MTRTSFIRWGKLALLISCACSAGAQVMERKEISSLSAAEVESLRRGVAKMKERDSAPRDSVDFRRGWEFWSNNHAHFGAGCKDDLDTSLPGMAGQKKVSAANPIEKKAWCACRHDPLHFLAWHRVYLHFFERVLREASGDPKLALPFWDYGGTATRKLPASFREPKYTPAGAGAGAAVDNPLYAPHRNGVLLDGGDVHPLVVSYQSTMEATAFVTQDGSGFTQLLDQAPHGSIHCHIAMDGDCPNGLMGAFETAAKDPIFWLHHANLDRLTQCWMQGGAGRDFVRVPQFLNAVYEFVDETGAVNKKPVRDLLDISQLKYKYAQASSCGAPIPVVASSDRVKPKSSTRRASLAGAADFGTATPLPLAASNLAVPTTASSSERKERTYIVLRDVRKAGGASVYQVSLVLPDGEVVSVGVVSFFGSGASGRHTAGHAHLAPFTRALDVTELAARIGAASIPANTRIQVAPLSVPNSAPITASSGDKTISVRKIDLVVTTTGP